MKEIDAKALREKMVHDQIFNRGITDREILEVFKSVYRHLFVPEGKESFAYEDYPVSIGEGQTISQPYIVALMTKSLDVKRGMKVLEIGTGSGYQAAILCCLGLLVYSVERIFLLAQRAKDTLDSLGYKVKIKIGDGTLGWQECAPYDRIIVTAASACLSPCLEEQLKVGGKMVLPLGDNLHQELTVIEKISEDKIKQRKVCGCIFVPLIGKYGYKE